MDDLDIQQTIQVPKFDLVQKPVSVEPDQQNKVTENKKPVTVKVDKSMSRFVRQVDDFVQSISTKVTFSIDAKTGKQVIIVSENKTGKIIRQIPPKEMLDLIAKMKEINGIIFNGKI